MLWSCFYTDVHVMGWEGVKAEGEKQIRSVESARRSVGKSLEGRGVEAVAQPVRVLKCICNQQR